MELGSFIRDFRELHEISMQEFADRCGLSKGYISMLEKGQHPQSSRPLVPSLDTLKKVAVGMNITFDTLLSALDGDTEISVNDIPYIPAPAMELSSSEQQLLDDFRSLNEEGREKVSDYAADLVASGRYKKESTASAG